MVRSSRTHFEDYGFEASSPQKLSCPTIFESLKFCRLSEKNFCCPCLSEITSKKILKTFFLRSCEEKFLKTLFFFFWGENTCACGLGLEHSCPRPRNFLGSWPRALCPRLQLCPLKPNFEPLSPLSHINFSINFIPSTPKNTIDGS